MGRVEISHICREFVKEDGLRVVALSDITLSIADDEFVSFVGRQVVARRRSFGLLPVLIRPARERSGLTDR
jgi:ABC-type taurine transport system ATPase subunit